jgi:hypothetical protein
MKPDLRIVARFLIQAEVANKAARGFLRHDDDVAAYAQIQLSLSFIAEAEKALGFGLDG